MIAGAALLVLLGLVLFVAGILTGLTGLFWGCVAACVVAAVLLLLVRRRLGEPDAVARAAPTGDAPAAPPAAGPTAPGGTADAVDATPGAGTPEKAAAAGTEPSRTAAAAAANGTAAHASPQELPDPPVEDVEVTDLLLVVDLKDEVLVIDEHPRYHLAGCVHLTGRTTIPLPLDEARADGFTPCAVCAPDRHLAERARARK